MDRRREGGESEQGLSACVCHLLVARVCLEHKSACWGAGGAWQRTMWTEAPKPGTLAAKTA